MSNPIINIKNAHLLSILQTGMRVKLRNSDEINNYLNLIDNIVDQEDLKNIIETHYNDYYFYLVPYTDPETNSIIKYKVEFTSEKDEDFTAEFSTLKYRICSKE